MESAERQAHLKEWVTAVHNAEREKWTDVARSPCWSLVDGDSYLDASRLYPKSESARHYHLAFDLGVTASDMADIAWATRKGTQSDLLRAVKSRVPASYMLSLNEAYEDVLTSIKASAKPYPSSLCEQLYQAGVPAEYAAALIRKSTPPPSTIVRLYESGVPIEFATELDLEGL